MKTSYESVWPAIKGEKICDTCNFCGRILGLRGALFLRKIKDIPESPIEFCCDKCKKEWEELYA